MKDELRRVSVPAWSVHPTLHVAALETQIVEAFRRHAKHPGAVAKKPYVTETTLAAVRAAAKLRARFHLASRALKLCLLRCALLACNVQ